MALFLPIVCVTAPDIRHPTGTQIRFTDPGSNHTLEGHPTIGHHVILPIQEICSELSEKLPSEGSPLRKLGISMVG